MQGEKRKRCSASVRLFNAAERKNNKQKDRGLLLNHSFEEGSRIVAARHFFSASEAHLYAARLREAGIPHYISNTNIMTVLPLGGGGGIGLHVRAQDLEEATRIIARLDFQKQQTTEADFRDADLDDIEYQRQLSAAASDGRLHPYWYWALLFIAALVALRAYLRASGAVNRWWDFF